MLKRYGEIVNYTNYQTGAFNLNTGHFTQLVWRGAQTQSGGLSVASAPGWSLSYGSLTNSSGTFSYTKNVTTTKYSVYVVADYYPPGNMQGAFAANVLPPTGPNNCPN